MNERIVTLVIAVMSAVLSSGAVAALVTALMERRRTVAEAKKIEAETKIELRGADTKAFELAGQTYEDVIKMLRSQIEALVKEQTELKSILESQEKEISELRSSIEQLRAVNGDLLAENASLRLRLEQWDDLTKLFGQHG